MPGGRQRVDPVGDLACEAKHDDTWPEGERLDPHDDHLSGIVSPECPENAKTGA